MDKVDPQNVAAHGVAIASVLGALAGWLPSVGAMLAVIWYAIQIWESQTVANWRRRIRDRLGWKRPK